MERLISFKESVERLKRGEIGVIPTDTLYGIVGSAFYKDTVERIYKVKKRSSHKPFIILIGSLNNLSSFGVTYNKEEFDPSSFWPGKVSIIFPCPHQKFQYLHRGEEALAFRLPKNKDLIDLLEKTGPLVAPSANLEGHSPVQNIKEAMKCFKEAVDFYIDGGDITGNPSTLISFLNGKKEIERGQ